MEHSNQSVNSFKFEIEFEFEFYFSFFLNYHEFYCFENHFLYLSCYFLLKFSELSDQNRKKLLLTYHLLFLINIKSC
jgi:hypothetical protein